MPEDKRKEREVLPIIFPKSVEQDKRCNKEARRANFLFSKKSPNEKKNSNKDPYAKKNTVSLPTQNCSPKI